MKNALFAIPGTWRIFVPDVAGDELVVWAQRALEAGLDTLSLRKLAASDRTATWSETFPLLNRSLQELGLTDVITEDQARRHHLSEVARQMVAGTISVEDGLAELHQLRGVAAGAPA